MNAGLTSEEKITTPKLKDHVIINPKTICVDDIFGLIKRKKHVAIEEMNHSIAQSFKKKEDYYR